MSTLGKDARKLGFLACGRGRAGGNARIGDAPHVSDSLVRVSRRVGGARLGPVPSAGPRAAPGRELAVKPRSRVEARRRGAADPARRSAPGENPRLSRRAEAGPIRVSSYRFQALFDSLFKVLCIFPSRYLFAIGLSPVFSFRWNLPPTSSCNPKQPDSARAHRADTSHHVTGFSPSPIPCSKGF